MNFPLDTNDAALARPAIDAFQRNGEARPSCVVCRAEIVDNHWFGRLPQNGNGDAHAESVRILLCSPRCALKHFATLRPRGNGFEPDYEQYERSVHMLVDGEKTLMALKGFIACIAFALLISGCAHYPVNAPVRSANLEAGYRFQEIARTNSDDLLLMLAFSGGGTRAAALSYGVLEELRKTEVGSAADQHCLLDDVGLISSVSGGSFTAAYYALWGDRIFTDFEPGFLKKRVQTALLLRALAPWNGIRLASPGFGRSDLAAEYYDRLLFNDATFGDLMARNGRPYLSVNATDIGSGARFEFTQEEFDLIGSDLAQFPISRAVAASSAFPVLLTPIVLKNYSAKQRSPEPEWIRSILDDSDASTRLRYVASQARTYVRGQRQYVHLLDGGLSDNLGLRGALDRAMAHEEYARIPGVPPKLPRRIAIIVVNAHTDSEYGWDSNEYSLGLGTLLRSLGQVTVSHYSFETVELFKEVMTRLSRDHDPRGKISDGQPNQIETYVVELHFRQVADESDRRFFNSVPTSLQLPAKSVDRLRVMAARELADNREFKRLVADLTSGPAKPNSPQRTTLASKEEHQQ